MNFMQLLKSLDDLLYEVMSWLVFYPVTMWRALTRPLKMMDYSDAELGDRVEEQYTDTLSPPLFLLLSLIISHLVELASIGGQPALVSEYRGLAGPVDDDTSLLILRLLMFSIFPLIMATRLVRKQRIGLTRDTLRPPFLQPMLCRRTLRADAQPRRDPDGHAPALGPARRRRDHAPRLALVWQPADPLVRPASACLLRAPSGRRASPWSKVWRSCWESPGCSAEPGG